MWWRVARSAGPTPTQGSECAIGPTFRNWQRWEQKTQGPESCWFQGADDLNLWDLYDKSYTSWIFMMYHDVIRWKTCSWHAMYAMQDMLFAGAGARAAVPFTGLMGCIFRYMFQHSLNVTMRYKGFRDYPNDPMTSLIFIHGRYRCSGDSTSPKICDERERKIPEWLTPQEPTGKYCYLW